MGNQSCRGDYQEEGEKVAEAEDFKSLQEIHSKMLQYGQSHCLQFYPANFQKLIERLFELRQKHICDNLLSLTAQKREDEKQSLIAALEQFSLEDFDEIWHQAMKSINKSDRETFEVTGTLRLPPVQPKIINRLMSKDYQHHKSTGIEIIKQNQLLLIVTVQCFDGLGCFEKSELLTGKSLLYLFLQKVEAISSKYCCSLPVLFIVGNDHVQELNREISRYEFAVGCNGQLTRSIHIFKPSFPCLNHKGEILVETASSLKYTYTSGDLIGYLRRLQIICHYPYAQHINLQNILQAPVDQFSLGWLHNNPSKDIVAVVLPARTDSQKTLKVKNNFIEEESSISEGNKWILGDNFIVRLNMLRNSSADTVQTCRLSFKLKEETPNICYLRRSFEDVLLGQITTLISSKFSFQYCVQRSLQRLAYSNYCKEMIGLLDSQADQIVEICPQILFGKPEFLNEVVDELKKKGLIGFPLIINREKVLTGSKIT